MLRQHKLSLYLYDDVFIEIFYYAVYRTRIYCLLMPHSNALTSNKHFTSLQVNYLFELFYLIWLLWHGKHVKSMQIKGTFRFYTTNWRRTLEFLCRSIGIEVSTVFIPAMHMDINMGFELFHRSIRFKCVQKVHRGMRRPSCLGFFNTTSEYILSVKMAIFAAWSEMLFLRSRKLPLWIKSCGGILGWNFFWLGSVCSSVFYHTKIKYQTAVF